RPIMCCKVKSETLAEPPPAADQPREASATGRPRPLDNLTRSRAVAVFVGFRLFCSDPVGVIPSFSRDARDRIGILSHKRMQSYVPSAGASFGPAEAAVAAPAEEAEVAAVWRHVELHARGPLQALEDLRRNEWIVARRQNVRGQRDAANEGHGRGAT